MNFPLVTSLTPFIKRPIEGVGDVGILYQHQCIESWKQCGFQVISVNAASEVSALKALYPGVEIVTAERDESKNTASPSFLSLSFCVCCT